MKKYILVSFLVGFLLAPVISFAQVGDVDPNPAASNCVSITNNLRYRDRDANKSGEVSTLQDFLQSKGYLNSEPTGYLGLMTFQAVKDFQKANGISPTGYVGTITRAKISDLSGCSTTPTIPTPTPTPIPTPTTPTTPTPTGTGCTSSSGYSRTTGQKCSSTAPVISGVSGPQSLNINQTGTWTVKAYDPNGGNLTYYVSWGASGDDTNQAWRSSQQSATFTHYYLQAGTYTPIFFVTNSNGQTAKTSLSVNVGNVTSTNAQPVLGPIAVSTNVQAGQSVSFNFSASDADNDNLSWLVNWGDMTSSGNFSPSTGQPIFVCNQPNNTYTPSHTWSVAGAYTVKVSVSDCKGGTAGTSFSVNVSGTPPIAHPHGTSPWNYGWDDFTSGGSGDHSAQILSDYRANPSTYGYNPINYSGTSSAVGKYVLRLYKSCTDNWINRKEKIPLDNYSNYKGTNRYQEQCIDDGTFDSYYDEAILYESLVVPITPALTILSPNGGEKWISNQSHNITWKATNVVGEATIKLCGISSYLGEVCNSIGGPYVNIAQGYSIWSLDPNDPLFPSDKLKIKISATDSSGNSVYDYSDNYFTVTSPTPVLSIGDVNGDGMINCADADLIIQAAAGSGTTILSSDQRSRADVSGDGTVSAYDASLLMQRNGLSCSTNPTITTQLSVAIKSDSPSGTFTGGTGKYLFGLTASVPNNASDPVLNLAKITSIDVTDNKSSATVSNLKVYPAEYDNNSNYATTCAAISVSSSSTVWRCTLITAGSTNEVDENSSRSYTFRGDISYFSSGSVSFSVAPNSVAWQDENGTRWNNQPTTILQGGSLTSSSTPTTFQITSPGNSDTWYTGSVHNITWMQWSGINPVPVSISIFPYAVCSSNGTCTTGGTTIVNNFTSAINGTYQWTIPSNIQGGVYYIKLQSADGGTTETLFKISTPPTPTFSVGDVNGDGSITCTDTNMILQAASGLITLSADQRTRADINGDGVVNAPDATLLMQRNNFSCSTAVSGSCSTTHYKCAVGTSGNNIIGTYSYTWSCSGLNGGPNVSCSETKYFLGDVNGDNSIDCDDSDMILQAAAGLITLSADQITRTDMNGDGIINASDASLFMQKYSLSCSTVGSVPESALTANVLGALNSANNNEQNAQTSCGEFSTILSKGMNDPQVQCLQKMLNKKGFKVEGVEAGQETTYFGYNTLMALKAFQASNGLVADGILGVASYEALKK